MSESVRQARREALDRGVVPPSVLEQDPEALMQQAMAANLIDPPSSPEPYSDPKRPELSFFADLILVTSHDAARAAGRSSTLLPSPAQGSVQAARARLDVTRKQAGFREQRDLSSASTGLMSSPPLVSDAFAAAARAAGAMQALLPARPMPTVGMSVDSVRLTSGASVAAQAGDNVAVSNTDPAEAKVESPIATITGFVDLSRQLLEQGQEVDVAIAEELGRAYAQALDTQVISGSGASGQMQGFRGVASIVSVTFTTPVTPLGGMAKLSDAVAQVNTGFGAYPDVVVLHGRRLPWFLGQSASPTPPNWPAVRPVVCNSIPTTVGAGTEDILLVLASEAHPLYTTPPRVRVVTDFADSTNLTARIIVDGYATVQNERYPSAIGVVTGAGLIAPTYA